MNVYIILLLIFIITVSVFYVLSLKRENKYIKMTPKKKEFPNPRDFDIDYKYLNFIIAKECDVIRQLILYPAYRNRGEYNMISDEVLEDAKRITVNAVKEKLSEEQKNIISFYCGNNVDNFIKGLIEQELLNEAVKLNQDFINKLK